MTSARIPLYGLQPFYNHFSTVPNDREPGTKSLTFNEHIKGRISIARLVSIGKHILRWNNENDREYGGSFGLTSREWWWFVTSNPGISSRWRQCGWDGCCLGSQICSLIESRFISKTCHGWNRRWKHGVTGLHSWWSRSWKGWDLL